MVKNRLWREQAWILVLSSPLDSLGGLRDAMKPLPASVSPSVKQILVVIRIK